MKRFLSLLLTLCMLLTVITVSTVTVSATGGEDTILYKMGGPVIAIQQDFALWDNSKTDAENAATGIGSFTQNIASGFPANTSDGSGFTRAANADGSLAIKLVKSATVSAAPNISLEFLPDPTIPADRLLKVSYSFKFKGDGYTTSTGAQTASGSKAFLKFDALATINGADKPLRAVWLYDSETPNRGTGSGANAYSDANESAYVAGADGYHNLRIDVYAKDGAVWCDIYNADTEAKICYHKYNYASDYSLTGGLRIGYQMYGSCSDYTMDTLIKDLKATYMLDGIGSIETTDTTAIVPELDVDNNIIRTVPKKGGIYTPSLSFVPANTINTGNINVDFELKSETCFATDEGGSVGGSRYLSVLGTTGDLNYCMFTNDGRTFSRINYTKFYTPNKGNSFSGIPAIADTPGTFIPFRLSFSRTDPTKGWSIACYNLNTSSTEPIFISYAENIGDFKGFSFAWERPQAVRGAATSNSLLPKVQQPLTVKNLVMTKTDNIQNTSAYGNYNSAGANAPIYISGSSYVFENTIYVRTKSGQSAKAILAVTDANGKEVGKAETNLVDGINYPVSLQVNNVTSPSTCTAKLYIFDGENWLDGEAYVAPPATSIDTVSVKSQIDGSTAVMRFIFNPVFDGTVTKFGAYVIPYDLFEEKETKAEHSYTDGSLASGSSFRVDLRKIPQTAYGRGIVALPYIVLDGETFQADPTSAYTVNATNVEAQ